MVPPVFLYVLINDNIYYITVYIKSQEGHFELFFTILLAKKRYGLSISLKGINGFAKLKIGDEMYEHLGYYN
jgi:hypothetical protein